MFTFRQYKDNLNSFIFLFDNRVVMGSNRRQLLATKRPMGCFVAMPFCKTNFSIRVRYENNIRGYVSMESFSQDLTSNTRL